ncbi:peptide-aspartate beta-dioxygenase [Aureococcus anophagefferens]|nr:peptide-aspartate beta-dioxygenase [Aureococcus anophagefferens]
MVKVQLTLVEGAAAGFSVKLELPEKWLGLPTSKLVKTFAGRAAKSGKPCGALEVVGRGGDAVEGATLIGDIVDGDAPHLRLRPARAAAPAAPAPARAALDAASEALATCYPPSGPGGGGDPRVALVGASLALTLEFVAGAALAQLGRALAAEERYLLAYALCFYPDAVDLRDRAAPARAELAGTRRNVAHNLVLLLCGSGKAADAVPFAAAVARHAARGDAEPWYELGTVAIDAGFDDVAADAYARAIKANPKHGASYVNLIQTLEKRRGPGDATKVRALGAAAVDHGVLWSHAMQRPPHWFPGLKSEPWHDAAAYWFTKLLRDNFEAIRDEYLGFRSYAAAVESDAPGHEVGSRPGFAHDGTLTVAGSWKEHVFYAGGYRDEETCRRFPRTARVVDDIAEATGAALCGCGETLFSTLAPGTRLRPHCGSTNARLTCHFGVVVPDGDVKIRCGDEWRKWVEGDSIVFDDSWEHEVRHDGDSPRCVLLMNFWHPDFPAHLRVPEWRDKAHNNMLHRYSVPLSRGC